MACCSKAQICGSRPEAATLPVFVLTSLKRSQYHQIVDPAVGKDENSHSFNLAVKNPFASVTTQHPLCKYNKCIDKQTRRRPSAYSLSPTSLLSNGRGDPSEGAYLLTAAPTG